MAYDGAIRASDADRERVVAILREAYTEGRLDLTEFDERTTAAYAARTWAELRELTRDLPAGLSLEAGVVSRPFTVSPVGPGPGQLRRPDRGPVFFPFLPVVIFWFVVAGAARGGAGLVVPVVLILFIWLRMALRHRDRNHRPDGSPPRAGGGPA